VTTDHFDVCALYVLSAGDDQSTEPGQYDEKSIRYTGRNIPSRSFRMLQSMTGGDEASTSPGTWPTHT